MDVFGHYARYYDLLYRDKDYRGEAQFVHQLIQTHAPHSQSLLELGCGTGRHAALLAELGYSVEGVDQSAEMLASAQARAQTLSPEIGDRLSFSQGDIRNLRLGRRFDVVTALFHVVSYQTTNEDLQATFATVKEHLNPNGIFIFDVWYGPAVLSDPPVVRVKRLEDEQIKVTRIAEPILHPNENLVDVNYHIFIRDIKSGIVEEIEEIHVMRYLFMPEILLFSCLENMRLLEFQEWISQAPVNSTTWNTYYILKKI